MFKSDRSDLQETVLVYQVGETMALHCILGPTTKLQFKDMSLMFSSDLLKIICLQRKVNVISLPIILVKKHHSWLLT